MEYEVEAGGRVQQAAVDVSELKCWDAAGTTVMLQPRPLLYYIHIEPTKTMVNDVQVLHC